MSRCTLFHILIAFVAHARCLTLHTVNETVGDDDNISNDSIANISCEGGLSDDDKIINAPECATTGYPYCQRLYGEDAGTHVRFMTMAKDSSFVCFGGGEGPLFTGPSAGDADCAAKCLGTLDCNFYMSWDDADRTCQGLRRCNLTESENPSARVSIYQRKRGLNASPRYQQADNQSSQELPPLRMIATFEFNEEIGEWRDEPFMLDRSGTQYGRLWLNGDLPSSYELDSATRQYGGKFGYYWGFNTLRPGAGLKIPLNEALTDYSAGPGATIAVTFRTPYRFPGHVPDMGRIWAGPNIELYAYSSGLALNMNGIRCLYHDPAITDDHEFHTVFVSVTFATGYVEIWRDDVFLGNGTYGPPIDEWELIRTTETWFMGIRPVAGSLRPFSGDMDEFAMFNWHFRQQDREKYLGCGGRCFEDCPDEQKFVSRAMYSRLPWDAYRNLNDTETSCIQDAVITASEGISGLSRPFVSYGGHAIYGMTGDMVFQSRVATPPCEYNEINGKFGSTLNFNEICNRTVFDMCGINLGFNPDSFRRIAESRRLPSQPYFMEPHIHPRILIVPADIVTVRETFSTSKVAKEARKSLESVKNQLFDLGSAYGQLYRKLYHCDLSQFGSGTTVEDMLVNQRNNTDWIDYPDIYTMFHFAALLALIDDNNKTAAELGAALACHSTVMLDVYVQDANGIANEDCEPNLGLAYDYLYNAMTQEQRQPVRQLIARYTEGRSPFDSNRGPWAAGGSPAEFYSGVVIQSLGIEGEEGYNRLVYLNELKRQRALYNSGAYEPGYTRDSWTYFMLLAADIRGTSISGASRVLGQQAGRGRGRGTPPLAALLASSRAGLR